MYIFIPIIVGMGKERRTLIGPYGGAKAAPVTRTTLRTNGPVPADSRQYVCMYCMYGHHI